MTLEALRTQPDHKASLTIRRAVPVLKRKESAKGTSRQRLAG